MECILLELDRIIIYSESTGTAVLYEPVVVA